MYATEVSPDFISSVSDAAMSEVGAWQSRPLERMYPVVFFDALRVKIRDEGVVRRVIYTTNAIESVNARVRKIIKTRGHFLTDEAATKLIWLALRNVMAEWGKALHHWEAAMNLPCHFV